MKSWFIKRNQEWQPILVLIFIEFLFALLSEQADFYEHLRSNFNILHKNSDLFLSLVLSFTLLLLWVINNKRMLKIFTTIYVIIDTFRLMFAIFSLIPDISNYTGIRGGDELFKDVIYLWFINVIVFGVWYWLVDAGGPYKRSEEKLERRDFLFPQFSNSIKGWEKWKPDFADYLFLAFNTSTTFGPTDTMVLSKRVKILMMIQVVASFTSFAVIAARAVTILK